MGLLSFILSFLGCGNRSANGQTNALTGKVNFEVQLETFIKLGFQLSTGTDTSDINRWGGHEEFENAPYSLMYMTLRQTIEKEPWTPITNKCWDFDTEAIEDHGAYIRIIENLERITRGELKFENIKDYVDIEKGEAWVSFTLNSIRYKWDLTVDDDWVDTTLFSKIVDLTKRQNTKGKYTFYSTGGQNIVIGFETPEELEKIKKETGLDIVWLN